MLVSEWFVYRDIAVAVAEVGGFARAFARAGGPGNGVDVNVVTQQVLRRQRKQCQHDGSGETARVGHVVGRFDLFAVLFTKAEYKLPVAKARLVSEVIAQVDDLALRGELVFLQKCTGQPMPQAEEDHVGFIKGVGKHQVGLPDQVSMHFGDRCAGGGAADDRLDMYVGVAEQDAKQFARGVPGTAYYANINHCREWYNKFLTGWPSLS